MAPVKRDALMKGAVAQRRTINSSAITPARNMRRSEGLDLCVAIISSESTENIRQQARSPHYIAGGGAGCVAAGDEAGFGAADGAGFLIVVARPAASPRSQM